MRHITFDESTVMGELLKIASEKQMISEAAVSMGNSLSAALNGKKFDTSKLGAEWVQYLNNLAPSTKSLAEYNKTVSSLAGKLSSLYNINVEKLIEPSKRFVSESWPDKDKEGRAVKANSLSQGNKDGEMNAVDNIKKRLDKMFNAKEISHEERKTLLKDTDKLLKDLYEFEADPYHEHDTTGMKPTFEIVDEDNKNDIYNQVKTNRNLKKKEEAREYCPWCETGSMENGMATCPECEVKMNKNASADVYDVSGETAEDLVESAHGKKGTETEVTVKPKDDGALVETVVEQHRKDEEVAKKDPTGAYASLIVLKSRLNKMGLSKYASKIDQIIVDLIPQEIVITHTLSTLSAKLKTTGHSKYAEAVSSLLKKKVVKQAAPGDTLREASSAAAKALTDYLASSLSLHYKPVIDSLRALESQGWGPVVSEAKRLSANDPKIQTAIRNAFSDKNVSNAVNILAAAKKGDMRAQEGLKPSIPQSQPAQNQALASVKTAANLSPEDAKKEFDATSLRLANTLVAYLSKSGTPMIRPMVAKLSSMVSQGWFAVLDEARRFAESNDDMKKALNTFLSSTKTQQLVLLLNDYKKDMESGVGVEVGPVSVQTKKKMPHGPKVKAFQVAYNTLVAKPFKPSVVLAEDGVYGPKTSAAVKEVGGLSEQAVKAYAANLKKLVDEGNTLDFGGKASVEKSEASYSPEQLYNFFVVKEAAKAKQWLINQATKRINSLGAKSNTSLKSDSMPDLQKWADSAFDLVAEQMKQSSETNPLKYRTELMGSLDAKIGDDINSLSQLLS